MKDLPIGIQEFSKLINGGFLYVDKTKHIYELINSASYYFLSRPRRFGKSLLLNTIKEVFFGNKELFKGLWIYDKIKWEKFPVIKISFSSVDYLNLGLAEAIDNMLSGIADENNIELKQPSYSLKFGELIRKIAKDSRVVILVDEYDKPIIDYINDIHIAEKNRKILKSFYSVIKDNDNYIRFFFVTGVSKFSHVSIFSDLNNLNDITLDENYSVIAGYTQQELEYYFAGYIRQLEKRYKQVFPDILLQIKKWYNGYSWDGINFVYNPFSILNFFFKKTFDDYWFRTGTPTFLTKLIKQKDYTIFDLENKVIYRGDLDKYEITSISLIPLLFQTGYLTIKKVNIREMTILLDFPNSEVERSFTIHLLADLNDGHIDKASSLLVDIMYSLKNDRIKEFIELINTLYKGISYTIVDNREKYFHSIFYIIVKLLGFTIESEILTIDGRIDAVITTDKYIYVIEFKAGQDAKTALQQIKEKGYHKIYRSQKKPVTLIGINFSIDKKSIDNFLIEKL